MTNRQASNLPPGTPIRRKGETNDGEVYLVERVQRSSQSHESTTVHASGHAFMLWEIERAGPVQGWPATR
jgi:hypothetical protein